MVSVRKAVFPVAGLGTRFLPATKASPKEMLSVVDKPLIQYAVEEAIAAGVNELIFVTSGQKRAIEDHFDKNYELEAKLIEKQKYALLEQVRNIPPKGISCVYIRQQEALGLGHAVLCARQLIGDEPFAVILADDLIKSDSPCLRQMADLMNREACNGVLAVEKVAPADTKSYGIVAIDAKHTVKQIVEKPVPEQAPSNLAVVGRYILPGSIFKFLENTHPGAGGEIQLTDAIAELIKHEKVLAHLFQGQRFDCGSKLGYLQANLEYGLTHRECGSAWRSYLKNRNFEN